MIFDKACGGDGSSSLGVEVGVGGSEAHTDSHIDRHENAKVDLSLYNPRANSKATTAHISITRVDSITLPNRYRSISIKPVTAVAFIIMEPEEAAA